MSWMGSTETTPGASRDRLLLYGVLAGLALALALARLATGPWYQVYNPASAALLEEGPVEWEVVYFLPHLPAVAGEAPPEYAVSPVQYRALGPLWVAGALWAWTGSAFWALAIVDLAGWAIAGVATYHLGRRLRAGDRAAALGALLVVGSPLLAGNMWTHVLHLAEFASLPVGLWGALVLLDADAVDSAGAAGTSSTASARSNRSSTRRGWGRAGRLALGLGALLVGLSLTYQYQWVVAPLAALAAATRPAGSRLHALGAVAGAVGIYLGATVVLRGVLLVAGHGDPGPQQDAVARPEALALSGLRTLDRAGLWTLLPNRGHVLTTIGLYHPVVFVAGVAGLGLLSGRARLLGVVALVGALFSFRLYGAPWTAMTAYPFVYLGAGAVCARAGDVAAYLMALLRHRGRPRPPPGVALATAVVFAALLAATTNGDLAGDTTFLLRWWNVYSRVLPY